jgi:hypothetical protein
MEYLEEVENYLEWVSNDRAIIRFPDMDDVNVKKDKLIVLIYKWLED